MRKEAGDLKGEGRDEAETERHRERSTETKTEKCAQNRDEEIDKQRVLDKDKS